MHNEQSIKQIWLKKEKKNYDKGKKSYLHFDFKHSYISALNIVSNPKLISSHFFYPLIHDTKKNTKYNNKSQMKSIKRRELYIASHIDAFIYSWYRTLLSKKYETLVSKYNLTECVIGYRSIKKNGISYRNIHFAQEIFEFIKSQDDCVILTYDIKEFFDTLSHKHLKDSWKILLGIPELPNDHYNVFKSLTNFSYVEKKDVYKLCKVGQKIKTGIFIKRLCTPIEFKNKIRNIIKNNPRSVFKQGIPQGTPISDLLSNIYMIPFDKKIKKLTVNRQVLYKRYCDDIILVCKRSDEELFNTTINQEIVKIGLVLHEKKTKIFYYQKGTEELTCKDQKPQHKALLQYLGLEFNGKKVYIRSSSISSFYQKVKSRVKKAAITSRKKKNPIIFKKKIYEQNTYLGMAKGNFITYAQNAAKIISGNGIKKQIFPHFQKIKNEILKHEVKNAQLNFPDKNTPIS